jgi:monolysocardiolipin acyltransferase
MFSLGRCIPCVRGEGIFQRGVQECIDALNRNDWVHVFPEGKVTPQPIRIKWGVSRMIEEPRLAPILLPIWLDGMQTMLSSKNLPRIGNVSNFWLTNFNAHF